MFKKIGFEKFSEKDVQALGADLSENNEYITETAGFIPLEVKLKQFEQNGLIAQFNSSDFDSHDMREMYLNPDFNITPEDEFEDVQEKIAARNAFIAEYKAKVLESKAMKREKAGTPEPEEKKAAKAAEEVKPEE